MDTFLQNSSKRYFFKTLIVVFLVIGAFVSGIYIGFDIGFDRNTNNITQKVLASENILMPIGVDFDPIWKAWHSINEKYVPATTTDFVNSEDKVWGMIQGLARSLNDPYTVFLPPEDAEIFEDDISGNFEGVGMEIGMRNGVLTVIAPLEGTPAHRAGIQSGDMIIKIDDNPTDDFAVDRAVKLIRGPQGTPVVFTIIREGENEFIEIEIIRGVIEIPTIDTQIKNGKNANGSNSGTGLRSDGVFIIKLHNFSAISPGLFRGALREFIESGTNKLILDLRGNPGGFLEAATDMTSWFLPVGKVIVTEDFGVNGKPRIHRSKGYNVFNDSLEMIILVNRGSASASEILAGALQEYGVAQLVGEDTFGKGSVQELVKITPDTSLKVTVARWLTPQGRSISDGGLQPDIMVEITAEDIEEGRDPQLDKAIEILVGSQQ